MVYAFFNFFIIVVWCNHTRDPQGQERCSIPVAGYTENVITVVSHLRIQYVVTYRFHRGVLIYPTGSNDTEYRQTTPRCNLTLHW